MSDLIMMLLFCSVVSVVFFGVLGFLILGQFDRIESRLGEIAKSLKKSEPTND